MQVKLMLLCELEQLEEYYVELRKKMPRNLTMAVSVRKQTLADDPVQMEDVKKKKMKIGRSAQHPHHIHPTHTTVTQLTLHNSVNDAEFELA